MPVMEGGESITFEKTPAQSSGDLPVPRVEKDKASKPPRSASGRGKKKQPSNATREMGSIARSQTAPDRMKRSSSRNPKTNTVKGFIPEEPDMWEVYLDPEQESEPKWNYLITAPLKRMVMRH